MTEGYGLFACVFGMQPYKVYYKTPWFPDCLNPFVLPIIGVTSEIWVLIYLFVVESISPIFVPGPVQAMQLAEILILAGVTTAFAEDLCKHHIMICLLYQMNSAKPSTRQAMFYIQKCSLGH